MATYSPECPYVVHRASMLHRWDSITFLHWPFAVDEVQRLLPPGLEVEPFEGEAWVGLVPFFMEVTAARGPSLRRFLSFPETNVRTYVTGPDGDTGVWFFSLDAGRLDAVVAARATYRVPYFWSDMSVTRSDNLIDYSTRRRWPGPREAHSRVQVEIGNAYSGPELRDFDHYLTARFTLFGIWGESLFKARAAHPPWTLHRATARVFDDELVAAAGLPQPTGHPVVHWSPGTDVRIGFPTRLP